MSLAEMKAEVVRLSTDELDELTLCIDAVREQRDPNWVEEAVKIRAQMASGRMYFREDLLRIHEELERDGR